MWKGNQRNSISRMPFKILAIAEFAPRNVQSMTSEVSERVKFDKDTFNEVIRKICPQITIDVPNRLSDAPERILVDIPLKDINSFRPEWIVEKVPHLRELMEVRKLLLSLRERSITREEFYDRLDRSLIGAEIASRVRSILIPQGKQKVESSEKKNIIDELLETVEMPRRVSQDDLIGRLVSLLTSSRDIYSEADQKAIELAIVELDALLESQVREIIHHQEFIRLESTWRGLKFLLDRTDLRENIQLELMSVPKESLLSAFHELVYQVERDFITDFPLSVIIADYEFDNSTIDLDTLSKLSDYVSEIQVPFISSVGFRFFGVTSPEGIQKLPYLRRLVDREEYIKWNSFRRSDSSRWVSLVFNRFLLRMPYGDDNKVKTFDFKEKNGYLLWGNPVWTIGALLSSSFIRIGWATRITGTVDGKVEDLPIYRHKSDIYIPLENLIPQQTCIDLSDIGICCLTCRPNSDTAMLMFAPTCHEPEAYSDPKWTEASKIRSTLPFQMLLSRLANIISAVANQLTGRTTEEVETKIMDLMFNLLSIKGSPAVEDMYVSVKQNDKSPGYYDVTLRVRPGAELITPVDIEMNWKMKIW